MSLKTLDAYKPGNGVGASKPDSSILTNFKREGVMEEHEPLQEARYVRTGPWWPVVQGLGAQLSVRFSPAWMGRVEGAGVALRWQIIELVLKDVEGMKS